MSLSANLGVVGVTGAVVEQVEDEAPKKSPYLMIAAWVLLVVIAGNVVYFTYSRMGSRQQEPKAVQPRIQDLKRPELEEPPKPALRPAQEPAQTAQATIQPISPQGLYFADGTPVQSVSELLYFVQNIPEEVYMSYVTPQRNEVALWTDDVLKEPRLALRIHDAGSRQEMVSAINFHMIAMQQKQEEMKHAAELRAEIEKLKSELDFL
jgi:hypothetical protein